MCLLGEPAVALRRDPQLGGDLTQHLDGQQFPAVDLEVAQQLTRIAAGPRQPRGGAQGSRGIAGDDRLERFKQLLGIGDAEHRQHVLRSDRLLAGVRDELLERAERVAEAARRVTSDQRDGSGFDRDLLLGGDAREHPRHLLDRRAAEVKPVAAIDDRRQHFLGFSRGEHEDRPRRRLLQGLQERVPGLLREHVRLVEDVDLVTA